MYNIVMGGVTLTGSINIRIEMATLMENINKYYPGTASFSIKAITPFSTDSTVAIRSAKSANKTKKNITGNLNNSTTISLTVPKDIVRDYKSKIIPKGTIFYVAFIGGDINKPRIIGME